jgi:putative endonuclease
MTHPPWWKRVWARLDPRRGPSTPLPPSARGRRAESYAARHLRRRGHRLLERNLRFAGGEIDLVTREGDWLVIVEVRSYRQGTPLRPRATLGPDKTRRLRRLAEEYAKQRRFHHLRVRVDLVEVATDDQHRCVGLEVLRGIA